MKIIYSLSTAQRKALLIQGQTITLAIPVPPIEIDDPADWVRSVLPSEFRPMVVAAEEEEILVEPSRRTSGAKNLTELLGAIADESSREWLVTMLVVRATLSPPNHRHQSGPAKWPVNVVIDGKHLLGVE